MIKAIHQYLSVKQYLVNISFDGGEDGEGDDGEYFPDEPSHQLS